MSAIEGIWNKFVSVTPNNFIYKSLSNWACNIAVGCNHKCRFCYVPDASTNKMGPQLKELGVDDPDAQWGDYVFLRPWDEGAFRASVRRAQKTPISELKPDGNRAIMFCSTTDAYQLLRDRALQLKRQELVRNALRIIRDESDLNVRILTRSPLAREDFDLFRSFGKRLLLGSSIPTLDNRLAKIYEPHAPAPIQRLNMLKDANLAGLHTFVAMAPTYPECDGNDIVATMENFEQVNPVTIFHEPINIRAENVARIETEAKERGLTLNTSVFQNKESWERYALNQLLQVETVARTLNMYNRLHLWPDKDLLHKRTDPRVRKWIERYHNRISEWPK